MKKFKQDRVWWYRGIKRVMRLVYKKPKFVFLGGSPEKGSIILSNHEGTYSPLTLEIYAQFPIRFWGTSEMNSGLKSTYRYLSYTYYHQKKHWNLFGARMFCLIAAPLSNLFYKGLKLISTYRDANFLKTIRESCAALNDGNNIVIFPEKSEQGYFAELSGFYAGFVVLAKYCLKKGVDLPVYVSYYRKQDGIFAFDAPVKFSELQAKFSTREEIAEYLLNRCNALGKYTAEELEAMQKENQAK